MVSFTRRNNGEILNAAAINELQQGIETNDAAITTNTTNIASNAARITTVENALPNKSDTTHTHTATVGVTFVLDGLGIAVAAGTKTELRIPYAGTIVGWTIIGDRSGSIVCTINRATYANYPTFTAISGTAKPTLTSAQKNQTTTLTGWTTAIAAGDILQISVDSATTVQRVMVSLDLTRSI